MPSPNGKQRPSSGNSGNNGLAGGSSKIIKAKRPSKIQENTGKLVKNPNTSGDHHYSDDDMFVASRHGQPSSSFQDHNDLMTKFTNESRRLTKNSHRPRGKFGRGLTKKGGAGGHYIWGAAGSELNHQDPRVDNDPADPNYDSDSELNCKFEAITPPLDDEEAEKYIAPVIKEYFDHGDIGEVCYLLEEVNLGNNYHLQLVVAVTLAMESKASHREMVSRLISELYGRLLTDEDIERGFQNLLDNLIDLHLDTPDAANVLGCFISRSIADDCIPPKFVQDRRKRFRRRTTSTTNKSDRVAISQEPMLIDGGNNDTNNNKDNGEETDARSEISFDEDDQGQVLYRDAINHAYALLNMKPGLARLDTVWGISGGTCPVKSLINQMRLLLKEYLSSGDTTEAARCLQELEVPHFYHHFIYESILYAIESSKDEHSLAIVKLIKHFSTINLISVDQLKNVSHLVI